MAFSACGRAEAAARTQQQRPTAVPVKGTFRRRVQDAAVAATVTVQGVQGTPARQPRQPLAVACAQPLRAAGARAYTIISPSGTASHGILANTRVQGGARGGPACVTAGHTLKNGSRRGALRFSLACYKVHTHAPLLDAEQTSLDKSRPDLDTWSITMFQQHSCQAVPRKVQLSSN